MGRGDLALVAQMDCRPSDLPLLIIALRAAFPLDATYRCTKIRLRGVFVRKRERSDGKERRQDMSQPFSRFLHPFDVARHPSLEPEVKRAILASWASDRSAV